MCHIIVVEIISSKLPDARCVNYESTFRELDAFQQQGGTMFSDQMLFRYWRYLQI